MNRHRSGLSVIEILVATVLLGVGIIFALGAISYATKATSGTVQSTEATAYARKMLEVILGADPQAGALLDGDINPAYYNPDWLPLYGPDGVSLPFAQDDFTGAADAEELRVFRESAQGFQFRVLVQAYRDPQTNQLLSGLYNVDLQLRWRDRLGLRTQSYPALYREE